MWAASHAQQAVVKDLLGEEKDKDTLGVQTGLGQTLRVYGIVC